MELSIPRQNPDLDPAPLLTVAMPVYNAGPHLRLAVLSILRQTLRDWELLLIDDGSTDDGLQTIADIRDPRLRILRDGVNKGLAARLNEAIDLARGRYLARMDADDVSYPDRFVCQLELLQGASRPDVVAVGAVTISDSNELRGYLPRAVSHERICAAPWQGFYFPHPTWMGNISWFRRHRYAFPGPYRCEDQELLLRAYAESRFETVDQVLFAYRVRSRVDWPKRLKTRLTLFGFQIRHFLRLRQYRFAFLALSVIWGRLASDGWLFLGMKGGGPAGAPAVAGVDLARWREVLNRTLAEP